MIPLLLLYQFLYPLIGLAVLARLAASGRAGTLRQSLGDLAERLGLSAGARLQALPSGRPRVWVHAASLGEVSAASALLERLREEPARPLLIVTASTVAGRDKAAKSGADLAVLAPFDFAPCVLSFLGKARPEALILLETELWPMTLALAARRGLHLGVANGRITPRAYARYRLTRFFWAPLLGRLERVAVQDLEHAARYLALGVRREALSVAGNIKYDAPPPSAEARARASARLAALHWAGDPVFAAGSTRPGEEEIILEAYRSARAAQPRLKLVLAPRHPERAPRLSEALLSEGLSVRLWSEEDALEGPPPDCLLVDRLGVLGGLYAWAAAAFVGGTLVPVGGHNVLEPAAVGCPVLFGPYLDTVKDPARSLQDSGGGILARDARGIETALKDWLLSPASRARASAAARETAEAYAGAAARALDHLRPLWLARGSSS